MPRIISSVAQKGGVGKTTLSVTAASHLADQGYKTCVIDFDTSQSNATRQLIGMIWKDEESPRGICDITANGGNLDEVIRETKRKNLFIIPSEKNNSRGIPYNIEASLTQIGVDGLSLLKEMIEESKELQQMHFIFIDTPPKLGIQTINSLIASDYFIIPVEMKDFSVESVEDTLKATKKVQATSNPHLKGLGVFVSSRDGRANNKEEIKELEKVCSANDLDMFKTQIPVFITFGKIAKKQKVIFDITVTNEKGQKEYRELVKELLDRIMKIEKAENRKDDREITENRL